MSVLDYTTIRYHRADGVAWLTLNRPDSLNAWIRQLGDDLLQALDAAAHDESVRVVVITGEGRAFSAGADLKAFGEIGDSTHVDVLTDLRESYNPAVLRLRTITKPVICAVNGVAAGIGCSLALAGDLVIAAESAYFLLAFVNIGLSLDGGASQSIVARAGAARALEMGMLGGRISAARALDWGLANQVVPDGELQATVVELAAKLAAGPPGSYASIKQTVNECSYKGFAELLDQEAVLQQDRARSRDFIEGVRAFQEKRAPAFTGE